MTNVALSRCAPEPTAEGSFHLESRGGGSANPEQPGVTRAAKS
jgi:hypothetical protein